MVINKKAVKQIIKDNKKQAGKEFMGALDKVVTELIVKLINQSKSTRLQAEDATNKS